MTTGLVTVGNGGVGKTTHNCNFASSDPGGESAISLGASKLVQATGGSAGAFGQTSDNGGTSGTGVRGGVSYSYLGGEGTGNGISGCPDPSLCGAGGGGGAGGAGNGLNGGPGVTSSITGSSVMYGSGGMGKNNDRFGQYYNSSGSLVSHTAGYGLAGAANTGRGGTDGCSPTTCADYFAGGSGIVVLRYILPEPDQPDLDASSDLGVSSTDNLTSDATPTITVSGLSSGATRTVTAVK